MRILLLIGLGSFLGGVGRYLLTIYIQDRFLSSMSYGTIAVNIIGCFLIGLVFGIAEKANISSEWRFFLATGILGGFTTFSSFSYETVALLREQQYWYAFFNVGLSVFLGLAATVLGILLAKMI